MFEAETTSRPEDPTEPTNAVHGPPVVPAVPHKSATQKAQETALNAYRLARMILFILLGFVLALFVFRNLDDVSMDYVFGSVDLPLAGVMLVFTAIGLVMGMLIYWFLVRRRD